MARRNYRSQLGRLAESLKPRALAFGAKSLRAALWIVLVTFAAQAICVSRAKHFALEGQHARAVALLKPWASVGLVSGTEALQLMSSALIAGHDYPAAVLGGEICFDRLKEPNCMIGIGSAFFRMGDSDRAEDLLLAVASRDPRSSLAHLELGRVAEHQGKIQAAAAEYGAAFDTAAENEKVIPLLRRIEMLNRVGKYNEAAPQLDKLRELSVQNLPGLYAIAETELALGRNSDFMRTMKDAEALRAKTPAGSYLVNTHPRLYQKLEDFTRASQAKGAPTPR